MVMEQAQGRAVPTLSAAGSPRLGVWGDALQRTGWMGLQQAGVALWGGSREAEHRGSRSKLLSRGEEAHKSALCL